MPYQITKPDEKTPSFWKEYLERIRKPDREIREKISPRESGGASAASRKINGVHSYSLLLR